MPEWTSDRIADPDGEALWLAVDVYPTEADALREARPDGNGFALLVATERFRLRDLDLDDEEDAYLEAEWGVSTTVEPDENGRAFWLIALHHESPYLPA